MQTLNRKFENKHPFHNFFSYFFRKKDQSMDDLKREALIAVRDCAKNLDRTLDEEREEKKKKKNSKPANNDSESE